MRLAELIIERYGVFAEHRLRIPDGAGLVIVHGPNEAGKSTCLEAISDFLFGVPAQTQRGSLFGYDGMRIGATLVDAKGTKLTLWRRKGRGHTLTDAAGAPLDDAVLAQLLGATTRDRFLSLFGLNHETLRSGGSQLLAADGDIGRLIVEAGGGLRLLMARLDAVSQEASRLFGQRKSMDRAFYKALEEFQEADREAKANAVTRDEYEQHRKAALNAQSRLEQLRTDRQTAGADISRLERLIRAAPHITKLEGLVRALEGDADLAELPDDFHERVVSALKQRRDAAAALEVGRVQRDRLATQLDGLTVDDALLGREARIRDVAEQAVHVRKARTDRENRRRDLETAQAELMTLRRMLNLPAGEDLAARIPDQRALDHVQLLANQAIERGASLTEVRKRAVELDDQLKVLEARLQAAVAKGFDRPASHAPGQFAALATQDASAAAARGKASAAIHVVAEMALTLGFESLDALVAFSCPGVDAASAEKQWHEAIEAERANQVAAKISAEAGVRSARDLIAQLEAAGPVASPAALAEAREARNQSWLPLRTAYLVDDLPQEETSRHEHVERFEADLRQSDDLADRRAAEAERSARLAQANEKLAQELSAIEASEAMLAQIDDRREVRTTAFRAAFPEATRRFTELGALVEFTERRGRTIEAREAARQLVQEADRLETELAPLRLLFSQAWATSGIAAAADEPLATQVQSLTAHLSSHEAAHAEFVRDAREIETLRPKAARAAAELAALLDAKQAWQLEWPLALGALGLDAELAPDRAGQLVGEWRSARATLGTIEQTQRRLTRMDDDETKLSEAVAALGTELSLKLPEDAAAAADQLMSRWQTQDGVRQQRAALAPELHEAQANHLALEAAARDAQTAVQQIADGAGTATDDDTLAAIAARCAARAEKILALKQAERSLADVGDGHDAQTLGEQLEGRDLDALCGALEVAKDQRTRLDNEIEAAIVAQKTAQDALERFATESGVNEAIAARESAVARMQSVVERYIELTAARGLIAQAIDKIRTEQQDPLVRRAGQLFALTTRGDFASIEADIDDRGQPVVIGRRASGERIPVATMSDGTRDQLFLAFRLASLENHAASTEPLPFVADDILVHFDDARSIATLDLLAKFGETNQVLLFTHHERIRDAGRALEANARASVVELDGYT
ncbi:MAG: AAA family ATPase [Hyphomicrobiaceae bacterium]